jgi:hypothetical protein
VTPPRSTFPELAVSVFRRFTASIRWLAQKTQSTLSVLAKNENESRNQAGVQNLWTRQNALAAHRRKKAGAKKSWACNTKSSRVIPDLSTYLACGCLTSQIGRDTVFSAKYDRTQRLETARLANFGPTENTAKMGRQNGPKKATRS